MRNDALKDTALKVRLGVHPRQEMRWEAGGQRTMWGRAAANILLLVLLAACGCKTSERSRGTREPAGMPAARGKQPAWLDPSAQLPGAKTGVPKGGSWSQTTAAAADALGGRVVDALGRPAKNVFIRIEPLPASPGGAMGIYSDDQGYFLTRGLKAGQSYQLTAEAQQQRQRWRGTVQTKVPNTTLTLVLREETSGGADASSSGTGDLALPPPEGVPRSRPPRTSSDGAFQPDSGSGQAVPPSLPPSGRPPHGGTGGTSGGTPGLPVIPPPQNLAPPLRPEHTADGPRPPYTPPPVSIPGPPSLPPPPPPPPVPKLSVPPSASPSPPQPSSQSQLGKPFTVVLVDPLQRPWSFPGDSSARVVVLEFVTSDCPHCRPVVPILKDLQARYGAAGVQIVGILCDELPLEQRLQAAQRYAVRHAVNYPVYVEPGAGPGRVRDLFAVEGYPTAVVLDEHGQLLWKGHPGKRTELEAVIRRHLQP